MVYSRVTTSLMAERPFLFSVFFDILQTKNLLIQNQKLARKGDRFSKFSADGVDFVRPLESNSHTLESKL